MLPFVFEDGMGFERYADYALDVPMYFVYRDGRYIDATGQSFRDFLKGQLPALPGERPTLSDWADHLTTIFPEARLKQFIEMRGADGGPWRRLCALPALWVGLLYDQGSLDAAWDLARGWDAATREGLRVQASLHGLQAEAGGVRMLDLAREVVAIADAGLKARGGGGRGRAYPGRDPLPRHAEGERGDGAGARGRARRALRGRLGRRRLARLCRVQLLRRAPRVRSGKLGS